MDGSTAHAQLDGDGFNANVEIRIRAGSSLRSPAPLSKRVWTDDFPAIALAEFVAFVVAHRAGGALQELLDVAAGGGRSVEKQDAAGVLPGMRDVAREERAGAGTRPR